MAEWHVSEELLGRFLRAEVSREESQRVVRHLLSECPRCSELAHQVISEIGLGSSRKAGWEEAYEEVFQRALAFATQEEQRLALERLRGWEQWSFLESFNPQARIAVVEADASFHTWGLHDRLLEASRWHMRKDPAEAVDIVRLAITVAEQLDTAALGEKRVADFLANAWAALGNVKRIASDFEGARSAFNEAWRFVAAGTGDPLEAAHIIGLEASYIKDIGEFETAESSLEEALEIYRKAGDPHQQGRILLKMGDVIGYANPGRGLAHIRKALALIDTARDPRLELCARHDLAKFLNESGQAEEALAVLDRARPLYRQFQDSFTQLRLHWLEGKIAANLGDFAGAESILGQLWEEFRVRDLNQEVVLVSIDLAKVLTWKGDVARAAELVAQCYSIMKGWGLHRDALAAWLVLQQTLAQGHGLGDIFQRIEIYYRRHWVRPAAFV
jgi:tetratricopeptide (TPR) repeat protein